MSDYINPTDFNLLWDGLIEDNNDFSSGGLSDDQSNSTNRLNSEIVNGISSMSAPVNVSPVHVVNNSANGPACTAPVNVSPVHVVNNSANGPACTENEFEDIDMTTVQKRITEQENVSTMKKTNIDINKLNRFLCLKGEKRLIHNIPIEDLDQYIANFILSCKTKKGDEYEPSTIRSMISSIDRYLKRHKYPSSIMCNKGHEFCLTRDAFTAKSKSLKKKGKGNRPNSAKPITDQELDKLYEMEIMGNKNPDSLLNTVWFNNCVQFGLRGTTEQYHLCWEDITLKKDADGNEYIELNERQTKTRSGQDITNVRAVPPRIFSTGGSRCPIDMYKLYASKRPHDFCFEGAPFYIAPKTNFSTCTSSSTETLTDRSGEWYMKQRVGMKKLGNMLKSMAEKAKLENKLTNHSIRKRMVQKLRDENVPPTDIMQFTGHKNIQSILNYSEISEERQKSGSHILSGSSLSSNSYQNSTTQSITNVSLEKSAPICQPSVNVQHPTHQNFMSQSTLSSINSQFYGAIFNIQNFNVYSK